MESLIRRQRLTFLVLCLVSLLVGNFQAAEAGSQVTRTLAYHQISSFTFSITEGGLEAPILTKDGSRAAFAISPGSGDPKNPNRIFAVNADGSSQIEVDSYTTLCFCGSMIDISADGSKIVSSDYVQLRIAQGDGSGALPLVALNSNQINAIAISGDATEVFFRVYRDTSIRGSDPVEPVQRGLWVINADGSRSSVPVKWKRSASLPRIFLAQMGRCWDHRWTVRAWSSALSMEPARAFSE